jgi:hypothetical protein
MTPKPRGVAPVVAALVAALVAASATMLAACQASPPDRRQQIDQLTEQIRGMSGVVGASTAVFNDPAQGRSFEIDVDVVDDITGDQLAAITSRYLDNLRAVKYVGYRTELDARRDWNIFAIDSGDRPVANGEQIVQQARNWVGIRHEFPGATTKLRATISHGGDPRSIKYGGHPGIGTVELPEAADYTAVTAAVTTLAAKFGDLTSGDWTISAGRQHPADIKTSRRLPNAQEMDVWAKLNADQAIEHFDAMTINGPVTGPVWVSERTVSRDANVALQLAQQHLPIVATLHPPIVYTANDVLQGHIGFYGQATGPVAVTVGGCTQRAYSPTPAEQALINTYEKCRR